MRFNQYIADRLPELNWRHFGVGALQAYLFEGGGYEQRVHIWHESLIADGIRGFGDMHNHRFSFTSKVLCGEVFDRRYHMTDDTDGCWDVYTVINAREQKAKTGTFDGSVSLSRRARGHRTPGGGVVRAGESYEFPRGEFHVTSFRGTTVTLVTKYDVRPGMRAEIVVPHGAKLVHAFDESRTPDIASVLEAARRALAAC